MKFPIKPTHRISALVWDVELGMGNVWEGGRYYRYPYKYEIRGR